MLTKLIKAKDKVIMPLTPAEVFSLIQAASEPAKLPLSLAAFEDVPKSGHQRRILLPGIL